MITGRQGGHKLMNQINVVPYIDVMLVLLVIFMVTAPLMPPGQIELPQVGKTAAPPVQPLEVLVRAGGSLALRDRAAGAAEQKVTRGELVQLVREKHKANPQQAVVIAADKDLRYEAVTDVIDALQQVPGVKMSLLVRPKGQ
jgi:biopolymer transport protein TolR